MSEVRRWKLKGFIPGIEGETKAVFQPTVVLAEDCDAALAREASETLRANEAERREAALREELDGVKYTRRKFRQERDALQQRLTDAEQKLGEAYEWGYTDGQNCPNGCSDKADRDKCVAELLKPEEGS
ncbi:hypothetical protein [Pseudomonas sp.]|uniref:hypothetical protein n=1 Tax=Pseudomonas sp. TaxID=306 RepID=UPI0026276BCF|nr:hypothetical protein [Pseudomonas sp.]